MNKKVIIIVLIILMIILIGLLFLLKGKQNNTSNNQTNEEKASYTKLESEAKTYYTIDSIIKEFNSYIVYLNGTISDLDIDLIPGETESEVLQEYREEGIEYFNDVLAKGYKEKYQLNNQSILNEIGVNSKKNYVIDNIYVIPEVENVNSYYVFGKYNDQEYDFVIVLDEANDTFEIYLDNYLKDLSIARDDNKSIKKIGASTIEENDNNSYIVKDVNEKIIVKDYFDEYVNLMKSNPEMAYEKLNSEYKAKRFIDYGKFKEYVDKIVELNEGFSVKQYKTTDMKSYTELVCKYDFGRTMIFYIKGQNNYSVALDSYTIPSETYKFEYSNSTDEKKAQMCLNRFLECINNNDYESAYSYLNDSFKSNNFASVGQFEEYVKSNWFELDGFSFDTVNVSGSTYVVSGSLYDLYIEGSFDQLYIPKNFMVRLGSDYNDFELSFEK